MDSIEIYRGDALSLRKEYRTLQSDGLNDYCNDPLLPCSAASSSTPSPQLLEKNIGFCSLDQGSQLAHCLALVSNMSKRGGAARFTNPQLKNCAHKYGKHPLSLCRIYRQMKPNPS